MRIVSAMCQTWRAPLFTILISALLLQNMVCSPALAREIPFYKKQTFIYEFNAASLAGSLEKLFSDAGVRVVLSKGIYADKRTLNGLRKGDPRTLFGGLAESNALISYFDGSLVYVYLAEEIRHRFLSMSQEKATGLRGKLQRMNLADVDNRYRMHPADGLIELSGTPRFIEQVEQLVTTLERNETPNLVVFQYIPLRYAWASDRTFSVGDREVTVRGIANILRELVQGKAATSAQKKYDIQLPVTSPSLRGQGLASLGKSRSNVPPPVPPPARQHRSDAKGETDLSETVSLETVDNFLEDDYDVAPIDEEDIGRIVADPQRNAIIVRDIKERIPLYEELVKKLDIPVQIVEIEATIIDVNADKLREMGLDWRYGSGRHEALFADAGSKEEFINAIAGDTVTSIKQLPGFQVGAIIGDKNRFSLRLNLLEQEGLAKVASRPKVVTLNDLEAVIENSRSVYIPVQGAYEVDLFKVFAGTVLRVTPHVIDSDGKTRIRMNISAEDGVIEDTATTGSPSVTRNALSTQALISAGASLLLGGMEREVDITETRKVPFLGDIPLIGRLFRKDTTSTQHSERLFLISPRLLSPDGEVLSMSVDSGNDK